MNSVLRHPGGIAMLVIGHVATGGAALASQMSSGEQHDAELVTPASPSLRQSADTHAVPAPHSMRAGTIEITRIAETGDEPPGRSGATFTQLRWPSIGDSGAVAFKGDYTGVSSGNEGVYRFQGGLLERVLDDGFDFTPPGQSGASSFTGFGPPVVNHAGHVAFQGGLSFADGNQGLYVWRGSGVERQFDNNPLVPVPGQPAGSAWSTFPFTAGIIPFLSGNGRSATIARYRDAGFVEHEGVYIADPASGAVLVADESSAPPGQAAALFSLFNPFMAMNGPGDLVFIGNYAGGIGSSGIYRYDSSAGMLNRLADGSTMPSGQPVSARFLSFDQFPSMNDAGQVAFTAVYSGGSGFRGVYRAEPDGTLTTIADTSGAFPVPGHPAATFSLFGPPVMNEHGDVAFLAEFGSGPDDVGVFLATERGTVRVFDLADGVPGQPGASFTLMGSIALNASAQIAVAVRYSGVADAGDEGLYMWDGSSLERVIDESQDLFGRRPTNLDLMLGTGGSGGQDGKISALNDAGQLVFRATFEGGDTGIYLVSPDVTSCDDDGWMLTVPVSFPGNAPDTNGRGAVAAEYRIGHHEVTNTQYVEFLNAIAADDPNGVYDEVMTTSLRGGIVRTGSPGAYGYAVKPGFADKPAVGYSWLGAARFCNWMHNARPSGSQDPSTTEDGAYDMSLGPEDIVRKPDARWFLPSHDEWYKAAYFDPFSAGADAQGSQDFWLYPTRSDDAPTQAESDENGDVINPGPNVANFERGVDWNGTDCDNPSKPCGNLSTVGSAGAVSPWGCFDMGGNANEWTDTPGNTIPADPPSRPDPLPTRVARGGDFANPLPLLRSSLDIDVNLQAAAANFGIRVATRSCEPGPCAAADLAPPYAVLNFDDVLAFLGAFSTGDPSADQALPAATLNFDDVLAFLTSFAAGCE